MTFDPKHMQKHVNIRPMRHLLYSFEADYGSAELKKLIEATGLTLKYFDRETNWISLDCYLDIIRRMREYTGDDRIAFKYGLNTIKYLKGWGIIKKIIITMATPSVLLKRVVNNIHRWGKGASMSLLELKNNRAAIELTMQKGFEFSRDLCLHVQGQMASIPTMWGLPHSEVVELQCIGEGAPSCRYRFTWNEYVLKRRSYGALFAGIVLCAAVLILNYAGIINNQVLSVIIIIGIFLIFINAWTIYSQIKSQFENINSIEEQDAEILESYLTIQSLSDDLQEMVDERTKSIKKVNQELYRIIDELEAKKEKVVQSEKMAAIGTLAAGMAHELNNPTGAIRNILQDVLEDTGAGDPYRKRLETAEAATGRCKKIVNDLLSFSWGEKDLSFTDVNINTVLDDTVKEAESAIPDKDIKIIKDYDPEMPRIRIDSKQIQQVFMNIIMNANDAIKESGEIKIRTSHGDKDVRVEISDTGAGIEKGIIDRIFDPFFSTKDKDKSMGMGLAISSNIIKRMNGDIHVNSAEGKGAVFIIILPVNQ